MSNCGPERESPVTVQAKSYPTRNENDLNRALGQWHWQCISDEEIQENILDTNDNSENTLSKSWPSAFHSKTQSIPIKNFYANDNDTAFNSYSEPGPIHEPENVNDNTFRIKSFFKNLSLSSMYPGISSHDRENKQQTQQSPTHRPARHHLQATDSSYLGSTHMARIRNRIFSNLVKRKEIQRKIYEKASASLRADSKSRQNGSSQWQQQSKSSSQSTDETSNEILEDSEHSHGILKYHSTNNNQNQNQNQRDFFNFNGSPHSFETDLRFKFLSTKSKLNENENEKKKLFSGSTTNGNPNQNDNNNTRLSASIGSEIVASESGIPIINTVECKAQIARDLVRQRHINSQIESKNSILLKQKLQKRNSNTNSNLSPGPSLTMNDNKPYIHILNRYIDEPKPMCFDPREGYWAFK